MTICFLVILSLACFCLAFRFLKQLIRERASFVTQALRHCQVATSHWRPALPTNSGGAPESLQIKLQVMAGSGEIVAITASQIFCRTSTNPQFSTSTAYLATSSSSLSKHSTPGQVLFHNCKNSTVASYKRKIHSNGQ